MQTSEIRLFPSAVKSGDRFRPVVRMWADGALLGAKYGVETFSTPEIAAARAVVGAVLAKAGTRGPRPVSIVPSAVAPLYSRVSRAPFACRVM